MYEIGYKFSSHLGELRLLVMKLQFILDPPPPSGGKGPGGREGERERERGREGVREGGLNNRHRTN